MVARVARNVASALRTMHHSVSVAVWDNISPALADDVAAVVLDDVLLGAGAGLNAGMAAQMSCDVRQGVLAAFASIGARGVGNMVQFSRLREACVVLTLDAAAWSQVRGRVFMHACLRVCVCVCSVSKCVVMYE